MIKVQQNNGRIELSGELDHNAAAAALAQSVGWIKAGDIHISLRDVSQSNSAGLALLLEWQKLAQQKNANIRFYDVPEQLRNIARAYGVDELLALA